VEEWNKEPELADALAKIEFNSKIAYGFLDDDKPKGVLTISNGKAVVGAAYNDGEALNWDLRASTDSWQKWLEKGLGMASLGAAYMTGKLKFKTGDYKAMIKDPRMAGPFVKSFTVMGRVS
jgi:putative sterol carrier protein